MSCIDNRCKERCNDCRGLTDNGVTDLCIGNVLYKISTTSENGCLRVYASPCTLPSCSFEIAQICTKENSCMQFDFYEAQVFTDPVVIIIDCNLCQIIKRALEIYLEEVQNTNFTNCSNSRRTSTLFGF